MAFLFDYLFDTNIFLRLAEKNSTERPIILNAIRKIRANNKTICFTPQILAEFWNVCSRPTAARGGFGLSLVQTERKVNVIQNISRFYPTRSKLLRNGGKLFRITALRAFKFTMQNLSLR